MALQIKSHKTQLANPGFDFGFKIMQVHEFRQIG